MGQIHLAIWFVAVGKRDSAHRLTVMGLAEHTAHEIVDPFAATLPACTADVAHDFLAVGAPPHILGLFMDLDAHREPGLSLNFNPIEGGLRPAFC